MPFRQRYRQTRPRGRFGLGHNMRSFSMRPIIHRTRNRWELVFGPTTAGTEASTNLVNVIEAPTNRGPDMPAGSILRSLVCVVWPTSSVAGKHQHLLVYRPAAENLATAVAAYWDTTDPLTEEGVKMRRLAMSKCKTRLTEAALSSDVHPTTLRWKGAKRLYDGDQITIDTLDAGATTYNCQVWTTFTQ